MHHDDTNVISLIRAPSADVLRELIDSRYTVYDVLPTFFNFHEQWITFGESSCPWHVGQTAHAGCSCSGGLRQACVQGL